MLTMIGASDRERQRHEQAAEEQQAGDDLDRP